MTSLHKAGIGNEISRLVGNSLVEDRINNSGLYTHIAGLERYATIEKFQIAKRISGGKRGKRVKYFRDDMSAPLTRSRMYRMTD